jgi:hypothetical protein
MYQQPKPAELETVVDALIDPKRASSDPLVQFLQVAMSGFGYNFYDARNVARSNDQLVREGVGGMLGEAAAALAAFEKRYRERFVPPATRENPMPSADAMRRLRSIDESRKACEALASRILTAETPATDMIWFRIRDEGATLHALLAHDVSLTIGAERVRAAARDLDLESFGDTSLGALQTELATLDRAIDSRRKLLRAV